MGSGQQQGSFSGSGMGSGSASFSGSGTGASSGSGSGSNSGGRRYAPRKTKFSNNTIVSEAGAGANYTRVMFDVDADRGSGVAFRVKYARGDSDSAASSYDSSRVLFHKLIEYVDTDGNGVYSGEAERVSEYRLGRDRDGSEGSADWTRTYTAPATDEGLHTLVLASGDGRMSFTVRFAGAEVTDTASGITVPPTAIKYDIAITDYPYTNTTHGRLALATLQSSATGATVATTDPTTGTVDKVKTRAVTFGTSLFAWADTVTVTSAAGATTAGVAVVVPDPVVGDESYSSLVADASRHEKTFRTVFNFDAVAPAKIVWDPISGTDPAIGLAETGTETGTDSDADSSSDADASGSAGQLGAAAAALAVCALALVM